MRVAIAGLGPIGSLIVRVLADREDVTLVGAVDIDPRKVRKDLGIVAGLEKKLGVSVSGSWEDVIPAKPDIAILATTSSFPLVADQAFPLLDVGIHVVTTCEEAVFPLKMFPEYVRQVDVIARTGGAVFLGVGVNPGFMMDYWPSIAAALLPRVDKVRVERRVDLSKRRARLQEKLGAGLKPEEVQERVNQRSIGHVGLSVSAHMLAYALGWEIEEWGETFDILVATEPVPWHKGEMEPGLVKGLRQTLTAKVKGEERIRLTLEMSLGIENPGDTVEIEGPVPLKVHVDPISGDWATASVVANALPIVMNAPAGFHTLLDLPPLRGYGE